jgi:2',3'-cyclic-nucleotide 2'-phosphodiesterase (5'-nucleotidase family)
MAEKVKGYETYLQKVSGEPIATTTVELDTRSASVRSRETAFGDLVADALRDRLAADIAIVNGGGIRGNTTYPAGYTLTPRDIRKELPFGNKAVLTELRGADIKAALENGFSTIENPSGRFPQVSGLTLEVEPRLPPGARVTGLKVNGQPLDEHRVYRVATIDFMLRGGDNYDALTHGTTLVGGADGVLMAAAVTDYVRKLGTVSIRAGGRILIR